MKTRINTVEYRFHLEGSARGCRFDIVLHEPGRHRTIGHIYQDGWGRWEVRNHLGRLDPAIVARAPFHERRIVAVRAAILAVFADPGPGPGA